MILSLLKDRGFIRFLEIESLIEGSPATLRRDLTRLEKAGKICRVHGGARLPTHEDEMPSSFNGSHFHDNVHRNLAQKKSIGKAASALCHSGESIIIDGGSTTLQMCEFLNDIRLNVLTNSLHIVNGLLHLPNVQVSLPAGTLFREQDIILSPFDEDGMDRYHATKMFMGAASLGPRGLMQTDSVLVQVERRLLRRADEVIVLADSSKFQEPTGHSVCDLSEIDIVVTDQNIPQKNYNMLEDAGVEVIVTDKSST